MKKEKLNLLKEEFKEKFHARERRFELESRIKVFKKQI